MNLYTLNIMHDKTCKTQQTIQHTVKETLKL